MYTEDYEKRVFPIIRFIIKTIIVILLILLLFWLLPKLLSPTIKTNNCIGSSCNTSDVQTIKSQTFIENIERIKDSAINYFTDEKLPIELGQSKKMSLANMINENIIDSLVDTNNNGIDIEKSYVQVTHTNDEYILKVYLKDGEEEDYILVHLGSYSYCNSYICEKRFESIVDDTKSVVSSTVPIKGTLSYGSYQAPSSYDPIVSYLDGTKPCFYDSYTGYYFDSTGNHSSKLKYLKSCLKPICKKISGYYFDNKGNSVSYNKFNKICSKEQIKKVYTCDKVNGFYYDKKGNMVSYVQYKKSCNVTTSNDSRYICKIVNKEYYDSEGNKVSKVQYIKSCKEPICEKVSGYYFGLDGDVISEAQFNKECDIQTPVSEIELLYEYSKTTGAELSDWTNWSDWNKVDCSHQAINCNDNDVLCLKKIQLYKRKEKVGTQQKSYAKSRKHIYQVGSYSRKSCSNYEYVEINNNLYVTSELYSQVSNITKDTAVTMGGWKYNGREAYYISPNSTATNYYIFVGAEDSNCEETCNSLPAYSYDSYSYIGGLEIVNDTTTPGSSKLGESSNISHEDGCGSYVIKTIPIYKTVKVIEKATRIEPLFEDACYESIKTRNVIDDGTTKYKWSTYNDKTLLNNGWIYTGNKKDYQDE